MLQSPSKTYHLTTIDLANLCAKTIGERYRALRAWEKPRVWMSYQPIRQNWAKLIAREPSLNMALVGDCKDSLLNHISRSCRYGEGDVAANIAVATAIWDWAEEKKATSIAHQFEPYRLPLSTNSFFESGIICVGAKGYGLLLDPRRSSSGLDHGGRDFAFSAMYWKVFGNADYVDLDLAIMKVTDSKKQRRVKLVEFDGQPVFTNEEVLSRIEETQKIWLDVQLERRHAASRGGEAL